LELLNSGVCSTGKSKGQIGHHEQQTQSQSNEEILIATCEQSQENEMNGQHLEPVTSSIVELMMNDYNYFISQP
jgi:hypothetical protein